MFSITYQFSAELNLPLITIGDKQCPYGLTNVATTRSVKVTISVMWYESVRLVGTSHTSHSYVAITIVNQISLLV